jgi:hypothetical protein
MLGGSHEGFLRSFQRNFNPLLFPWQSTSFIPNNDHSRKRPILDAGNRAEIVNRRLEAALLVLTPN